MSCVWRSDALEDSRVQLVVVHFPLSIMLALGPNLGWQPYLFTLHCLVALSFFHL